MLMSNITSFVVPELIISEAKRLGINRSDVAREALKEKIKEKDPASPALAIPDVPVGA